MEKQGENPCGAFTAWPHYSVFLSSLYLGIGTKHLIENIGNYSNK